MYLETMILVVGVLIATGVSSPWKELKSMCMCTNTHIYVYFNMSLYKY